MFHKTPNYTFSRQKGREISPTKARLNRFIRRVSSIKPKGGSKQARASIMSQPAASQTETNEPVGGDNGRTPNGIENTDPESAQIDVLHFGVFHDQVRDEVQKLQNGVALANSAVTELSKTFSKYGKIVRTVGERYENDQVLEEKIRGLKATNAGIWKHIEQDRSSYERAKSKSEREHAKEVSALQKQAEAGEREKEKYEKMGESLKDEHDQTKQQMAKDLEQKMTQLENDNAEKIANLEREQQELKSAKASLEQELKTRTIERDQEKETRETMQNKARTDIKRLGDTLTKIRAQYHIDRRPLKFYEDRYKSLIDRVGKIATEYFTELPEKAIDDPVNTSAKIARNAHTFTKVPIADSECSRVLRLANAQHIIFKSLIGSVWQPFFSRYLWKPKMEKSPLAEIYLCLAPHGQDFQQNWKVSTMKVLDQLDDKVDVAVLMDGLIEHTVIDLLRPLLDESDLDQFKDDLKIVYNDAIELGRIADRDQSPVSIDTTPPLNEGGGWKEYLSEEFDLEDGSNMSPTLSTSGIPHESLFVSPKIFRKGERASTAPTAATTGRVEIEVIVPGVALFPDTGIFQAGVMDWQRIRGAPREMARNINGKGRRPSTSTIGTGLGIVTSSPLEPSQRWPRRGTQDFD